jgi:hypothetical protein
LPLQNANVLKMHGVYKLFQSKTTREKQFISAVCQAVITTFWNVSNLNVLS